MAFTPLHRVDGDEYISIRAVFRKTKSADGKVAVERWAMDDIDAREAIALHPEEYSLKPWPEVKAEAIIDKVPPPLVIKPELLPEQPIAVEQRTPRV